MCDLNTFEYLLFDRIMSAIDTYKKCNLHSPAPYIGWGGNVRVVYAKKQGGDVRGETSGENILHPEIVPTQIDFLEDHILALSGAAPPNFYTC